MKVFNNRYSSVMLPQSGEFFDPVLF